MKRRASKQIADGDLSYRCLTCGCISFRPAKFNLDMRGRIPHQYCKGSLLKPHPRREMMVTVSMGQF